MILYFTVLDLYSQWLTVHGALTVQNGPTLARPHACELHSQLFPAARWNKPNSNMIFYHVCDLSAGNVNNNRKITLVCFSNWKLTYHCLSWRKTQPSGCEHRLKQLLLRLLFDPVSCPGSCLIQPLPFITQWRNAKLSKVHGTSVHGLSIWNRWSHELVTSYLR